VLPGVSPGCWRIGVRIPTSNPASPPSPCCTGLVRTSGDSDLSRRSGASPCLSFFAGICVCLFCFDAKNEKKCIGAARSISEIFGNFGNKSGNFRIFSGNF
jgi:hypothetical protein